MMRYTFASLLGCVAMVVAVVGCSSNGNETQQASGHDIVNKAALNEVHRLAKEFDADPTWFRALAGSSDYGLSTFNDSVETVFSVEISRALTGPDRIAFVAELIDVRENEDGLAIVFSHPDGFDQAIVFELAAEVETVNKILNDHPEWGDKYAVVCKVKFVDTPLLALRAYSHGDEEALIQAESEGIPRFAKGSLVAYTRVAVDKE